MWGPRSVICLIRRSSFFFSFFFFFFLSSSLYASSSFFVFSFFFSLLFTLLLLLFFSSSNPFSLLLIYNCNLKFPLGSPLFFSSSTQMFQTPVKPPCLDLSQPPSEVVRSLSLFFFFSLPMAKNPSPYCWLFVSLGIWKMEF